MIWIGGVGYGGVESYPGIEFNLRNDIAAANVVFDSGITVWQVPSNVYSQVSVSYAELRRRSAAPATLADYLITQTGRVERHLPPGADRVPLARRLAGHLADALPARRRLPDRAGAALRAARATTCPAPGTPSGVVESVDVRFLLEDMFAKIRRFGRKAASEHSTRRSPQARILMTGSHRTPAAGSSASPPLAVAGAGLTACTGVSNDDCRWRCDRQRARTTLRAVHLRGRRRPSACFKAQIKKFDQQNGTTTTVDSLPGSGAAVYPDKLRTELLGGKGPDVWRIWGGQIGAPFAKAKQAARPRAVLREVRLGHQDQQRGHRRHDLRRRQDRRAVLLPAASAPGTTRRCSPRPASAAPPTTLRRARGGQRQAARRRHHAAAAPAASTAGTSCGCSSTCSSTAAGPELHDKLLIGAESWDRPEVVDRLHQLQEVAGQEVDPGRARSASTRPTSSRGTCRARPRTPSPARGPRQRPSSRREEVRRTSASSSCPTDHTPARHSGFVEGYMINAKSGNADKAAALIDFLVQPDTQKALEDHRARR